HNILLRTGLLGLEKDGVAAGCTSCHAAVVPSSAPGAPTASGVEANVTGFFQGGAVTVTASSAAASLWRRIVSGGRPVPAKGSRIEATSAALWTRSFGSLAISLRTRSDTAAGASGRTFPTHFGASNRCRNAFSSVVPPGKGTWPVRRK